MNLCLVNSLRVIKIIVLYISIKSTKLEYILGDVEGKGAKLEYILGDGEGKGGDVNLLGGVKGQPNPSHQG